MTWRAEWVDGTESVALHCDLGARSVDRGAHDDTHTESARVFTTICAAGDNRVDDGLASAESVPLHCDHRTAGDNRGAHSDAHPESVRVLKHVGVAGDDWDDDGLKSTWFIMLRIKNLASIYYQLDAFAHSASAHCARGSKCCA